MGVNFNIIGNSPAALALIGQIRRLADAPGPVLVTGETGSGKELAARALHDASARRRGPFVAVNCAALPRDLVEGELFGTAAGAFTGAVRRTGLVVAAHGGTLFLDEIGDLGAPAQAAILRVLETREVRPVGEVAARSVDFRLVSATHRPLPAMVAAGTFRADLLHRIGTFEVRVPALRDRPADIEAIGRALVPESARLTPAAWALVARQPWPGNARELRNALLRAVVACEGAVGPAVVEATLSQAAAPAPATAGTLRDRIAAIVRAEVAAQGGNVRAAARALDISPVTAYRYLAGE